MQNHLADQPLLWGQRNGAQEWQFTGLKDANILFEVVRVLEIHAREMRERRHTKSDHIAAVPQGVRVDEPAGFRGRGQRIGAGNAIATRLKFVESVVKPAPFCGPVGDRRRETLINDLLRDKGIVG